MKKQQTPIKQDPTSKKSLPEMLRKARATKAAHERWKGHEAGVCVATHEGQWNGLKCAVLKDGRRIFSERSLCSAFEHVRTGADYKKRKDAPENQRLPVFVTDNIQPYISRQALDRLNKPIRYRRQDGFAIPAWGVEAELLPELCDAYMAARDDGKLTEDYELRRAKAAEMLLRGVAKVGIVALVDEATGYQVERDRDELQRLLEKYVRQEFREYTAMFPDEFYSQIFRLRGIATEDVRKRPAYFGKLTNDIVYERMLPGMLERLREVNPADEETHRRSRKHHQHLSGNQGVRHLKEHLSGIVYLMRASRDWKTFMKMLDNASPKQTPELPITTTEHSV